MGRRKNKYRTRQKRKQRKYKKKGKQSVIIIQTSSQIPKHKPKGNSGDLVSIGKFKCPLKVEENEEKDFIIFDNCEDLVMSSNKKRDNVIGENDDIKIDVTDKMGGITIRQREKSDINSCKHECKKTYKCGNDNKACKRKCKGKCEKNYSECVEPCKTLSKNKKKQCIKDNGCKKKKKKKKLKRKKGEKKKKKKKKKS